MRNNSIYRISFYPPYYGIPMDIGGLFQFYPTTITNSPKTTWIPKQGVKSFVFPFTTE